MVVRVRFAPSPTGFLHLGNLRTALLNWLFAKKQGGQFWLRLDDTDLERSQERYATALMEDLAWLGLTHDHFVRQSDRLKRYDEAIETLKTQGHLYPCYETPEELETKRKLQLSRGVPPVYDREGLHLTADQIETYQAQGRIPHWRFQLRDEEITWADLVRGPVHYHSKHISDPVLVRADGSCVYTLASVVDDIEMDITHILRGEDHVTNTAVQLQLFQALGGNPKAIEFGHFPLISDAQGQGFSKRLGSLSIGQLRQEGLHPLAALCVLSSLGTAHAPFAANTLEELVDAFDMQAYGRATPKLAVADLWQHHTKLLHHMSYEAIKPHLEALNLGYISKAFFEDFQGNLEKTQDLEVWWQVCHNPLHPPFQGEEAAFLETALAHLPPAPWDKETWKNWTTALSEATGRKGKALFHPLRLALTGAHQGPEMRLLLPWIGPDQARARLQG